MTILIETQRKQRNFRKTSTFCYTDYNTKASDCVIATNLKVLRDGNIRPPYLSPEKPICKAKNKLEQDMEQWVGSKLRKEYIKALHCHPVYLTSCKMQVERTTSWNGDCQNINNLRYADDTTLMTESKEEVKTLLMRVKEKSEKAGLKLSLQKTKIMAFSPIASWQIDSWQKDSNAGKDRGQEEKGVTEDKMVGQHHQLNKHEFE